MIRDNFQIAIAVGEGTLYAELYVNDLETLLHYLLNDIIFMLYIKNLLIFR